MNPADIAADLHLAIAEATTWLTRANDARTLERPRPGAWCAREVLGHLVDSACCNHRRFVSGQSPDVRQFDGYEQDLWVARQRYDRIPWTDLVAFWTAYNRHLVHVMQAIPLSAVTHAAPGSDGHTVTLGFLLQDYVRHLRHHLIQLKGLLQ